MFNHETTDTAMTTETETKTVTQTSVYSVHADRFGEVTKRAEKLNKRAIKLGAEPVTITFLRNEERPVIDPETKQPVRDYFGHVVTKTWTVFTIEGARPKADGWVLAARFDHSVAELGAPIIKSVPGTGDLAPEFRTNERTQVCEHCKSKRRRKDTFLVRHDDGRELVVGRQCIADFLGHNLAKLVPVCEGILGFIDELDGFRGSNELPVSLGGFLTVVTALVRTGGYVSKAIARDRGGMSTADEAWALCATPEHLLKGEERAFLAKANDFATQAQDVLSWAKEAFSAPKSDFDYNMHLATKVESNLPATLSGVAAYLPVAWMKANENQVKKEAKKPSEYVGTVGGKVDLMVTYLGTASFDSEWGTTHIHRFQDSDSNLIVWKTSTGLFKGDSYEWFTEGSVLKLRGSVKAHTEYKGTKQTLVLRVKTETA